MAYDADHIRHHGILLRDQSFYVLAGAMVRAVGRYTIVCLLLVFLVVLWVMSPRNSTDVFFERNVSSGWDNYFVAANLGALSNIFLFCCELICLYGTDA